MASPNATGPNGQSWRQAGAQQQQVPPQAAPADDEFGLQVRPMGLKVHYTFDKAGQVHCLARWPQILQVQTIPIDERNWIGVVDLRLCLQAIAQCSPEIVAQQDSDFTVYATDYSEPDTPLVGQGMLSWALDQAAAAAALGEEPKVVTGRVTKNLLAIFGNGIKETLEVKFRLTSVPRMQRADSCSGADMQHSGPMLTASTPTDAAEWNSFIQSNPLLGRSANVGPVVAASPNFGPGQPENPLGQGPDSGINGFQIASLQRPSPAPLQTQSLPSAANDEPGTAATPTDSTAAKKQPARPSRPSSRASTKAPTGRPRGRPRKKPLPVEGNTSAAEEATDADEGPKKKRAKITKADWNDKAPLGAASDSLRVAASTSGSLRTMRPVGAAGKGAAAASHLQEAPRAPTPIPGLQATGQLRKRMAAQKSRRESMASFDGSNGYQSFYNNLQGSQGQDARSPTDWIAPSPADQYTPEDSPADLGSSPPVPRSGPYMRSSPPPSSPILPPMPRDQPDSGFMSGGMDDMFDEDGMSPEPRRGVQARPAAQKPRARRADASRKNSRAVETPSDFAFQEENPGPAHLLPTTSIYNPRADVLAQNRVASANNPAAPQLKRANTAPNPNEQARPQPDQTPLPQDFPTVDSFFQSMTVEAEMGGTGAGNTPHDPVSQQESESLSLPVPGGPGGQGSRGQASEDRGNSVPAVPASEPPQPAATRQMARSASMGAARLPRVPASEPVIEQLLALPRLTSEDPCTESDSFPVPRSNKNLVKKQSIKERLQKAVENGEMPPFCNNCGAIETPTWRKMWTQDHQGVPEYCEYSEKPGHITAIDILERDAQGRPTTYRLVKKTLGPTEIKAHWNELLLCNPCGIWLGKFKSHRPPEKWDKDAARLNQPRKKREYKSRAKKPRTKSDAQANPTSEAYFTTDPMGPADEDMSPAHDHHHHRDGGGDQGGGQSQAQTAAPSREPSQFPPCFTSAAPGPASSPNRRGPGSTHSRGSGTADSPIPIEDDMGGIRRLLFPSPRKDGMPKVLGEVAVNIAHAAPDFSRANGKQVSATEKENSPPPPAVAQQQQQQQQQQRPRAAPVTPGMAQLDEMEDLFGTPPARPSTPPPNSRSMETANSGPFKTPTRPTPSHRPITRSVSKSIRSAKTIPLSPSQGILYVQKTPSRTPRSVSGGSFAGGSARRTPRMQHLHAHCVADDGFGGLHPGFESPFTATLNQLLSEANDFTAGSPSHGLGDFDLAALPSMDDGSIGNEDDLASAVHAHAAALDFSTFLSTDMIMPSSPPLLGRSHHGGNSGAGLGLSMTCAPEHRHGASLWGHLDDVNGHGQGRGDDDMEF